LFSTCINAASRSLIKSKSRLQICRNLQQTAKYRACFFKNTHRDLSQALRKETGDRDLAAAVDSYAAPRLTWSETLAATSREYSDDGITPTNQRTAAAGEQWDDDTSSSESEASPKQSRAAKRQASPQQAAAVSTAAAGTGADGLSQVAPPAAAPAAAAATQPAKLSALGRSYNVYHLRRVSVLKRNTYAHLHTLFYARWQP
jgi:hypothetical protein